MASAFANRDLFLALANYGHSRAAIRTRDGWVSAMGAAAPPAREWDLGPRSLIILKHAKNAG